MQKFSRGKKNTEITTLVSKLVSSFAHETREIAHKTSFSSCPRNEFFFCSRNECSRNECSRNEFFALLTRRVFGFAHKTSAHETSFFRCSRNECSRNEFFFAHETSAHETSFFFFAHETIAHETIFGFCSRNGCSRNALKNQAYDI